MKKVLFIALLLSFSVFAQVVTWEPSYITPEDSVTIIFDASEGNQGLMGYSGTVYAHAGVLLSTGSGTSDWRYVISDWGQNIPKAALESIGDNKYKLVITPDIIQYYGVSSSDQSLITHLAFVFRSEGPTNGGSYFEGKTAEGSDILVPLYQQATFVSPQNYDNFVNIGDTLDILATSVETTQKIDLYVGDNLITTVNNDSLSYSLVVTQAEKQYVKIVASDNEGPFSADSFYYIVPEDVITEALPAGTRPGINYISESEVTFVLTAPGKENVYLIGEFNNWEADYSYALKRTPDGENWWTTLQGVNAGQEYAFQYLVDEDIRIADPYAEYLLVPNDDPYIPESTYPNIKEYPADRTSEVVSVFKTAEPEYNWTVENFEKPAKTDLVIYELLIRDFTEEQNFQSVIDTLDYLKNLGINAIELMPVNEYEGNQGWGYNPIFYFAVDKCYGTKNKFKEFIDECHQRGIAVIMDQVLNHSYGHSPLVRLYNVGGYGKPTADNPWYNEEYRHPGGWGYDFNHESQYTKDFCYRIFEFWIDEYKIDGFRFDVAKGFTQTFSSDWGQAGQYDASRIAILKDYADKMFEYDPTFYDILEHFTDNSEEKELSDYGIMIWGNMNHEYCEAAMGYTSNLSATSYKDRNWNDPHLVAYMESHDEERLMYKNLAYGNSSGDYNVQNLYTALNRAKLASVFFFSIPGPKMIWQFGELGFDLSINWPSGNDDDRLTPKPPVWNYLEEVTRHNVFRVYQEMIKLKKNYKAFRTTDFDMDVDGYTKRIRLRDDSLDVVVLGNFYVEERSITPLFTHAGVWHNYFTGDSITVTNIADPIALAPGEFILYTDKNLPTPADGGLLSLDDNELAEITDYVLDQNYPNPFNPSTQISFTLPEQANVQLKVYNILGEEVFTLISGELTSGRHTFTWNGNDSSGKKVASGLYLYRLTAGDMQQTKKMMLLK